MSEKLKEHKPTQEGYWIAFRDGFRPEPTAKAMKAPGLERFDLFTHKSVHGNRFDWVVSNGHTGLVVARAGKKSEVTAIAIDRLSQENAARMACANIERAFDNGKESPRYQ